MLKSEIRILGFDDGSFGPSYSGDVVVIGVIYRGGNFLDGVLRTYIEKDGMDSTEKLTKLINSSRHKKQLKVIMLDGITVGGFNIIDVKKLNESTGLPVVVVNRKHPDLEKVREALKMFPDSEERWNTIKKAGEIKNMRLRNGSKVFYQNVGIPDKDTEELIGISCTHGQIPEALRVAHLIATAVVRGESFGRA